MNDTAIARFAGQIAGLITAFDGMIACMEPDVRAKFAGTLNAKFEPLVSLLLAEPADPENIDADTFRAAAENIRDLILVRLLKTDRPARQPKEK